jgi:ABC-type sugar transport system permease subunit
VIKGFELSFFDWKLGTPLESRKFVGWENFIWAWNDPGVFNSIKVTVIFAVSAVSVELCLGLILALLMEKGIKESPFFGRFSSSRSIAPVVVGLIWRHLFDANLA